MAAHIWDLGLDFFVNLCLLKLFFSVSRIAEWLITAECFILTVELNIFLMNSVEHILMQTEFYKQFTVCCIKF